MPAASTEISGHEARSAQTRARLIEAAIEVIGAIGYEATTTRELANKARTALSAIPYHFGGKKELYLAAARVISDHVEKRLQDVIGFLEAGVDEAVEAKVEPALIQFLHILLDDTEPRSWTSFFARCAYENDEAYALIHARAINPLLESLLEAVGSRHRCDTDHGVLRLRMSAILTAIISLRLLRGLVARSTDMKIPEAERRRHIEDMIRDMCRGNFLEPEPH